MSVWARAIMRLYRVLLAFYPQGFRAAFREEMLSVFEATMREAEKTDWPRMLMLFGREIRDWPGAVFQEHLRSWKGIYLNQNNPAWRPLNAKELLAGLALFVLPIIPPILKLIFGYKTVVNNVASIFTITILSTVLVILILGIKNGFPRWSIPYLSVSIITIIMLQAVYPLWGLFASDVKRIINYASKTLAARIQYSLLLNGFFWLVPFVTLVLLILMLRAWPRTRKLSHRIRNDWTLFSFMIYGGVVFRLELVFEEYVYDELWKIVCRVCLVLGAWVYFKNADHRKRILALLAGVTLTYWIAAVGKWVVFPLQSWGAFYGYDHWTYRRFELGSTIAEWVWVLFFMLLPALVIRIPQPKQVNSTTEETLTTA